MEIIRTRDFQKAFNNLPDEIKHLWTVQEKRFLSDWRDTRLHLKKVKSLQFAFSIRITRRYRAFFYFQDTETAIFFDIDHRKDAYRDI